MNILVFGGAGWLGRAVLANLAGRHAIRAFDLGPGAWDVWNDIEGPWTGGEVIHGNITDYDTVDRALEGMDAVIHMTVFFPRTRLPQDSAAKAFDVNLRGLWNVLEVSRRRNLNRIVHIGSCPTVHAAGTFFSAEVRRPDGNLYAVTKRLQEEMCRQFHEAYGSRIIVLRPDYIVDSRKGLGHMRRKLGSDLSPWRKGWVCRHDVAQACRLAVESETIDFDIFHIVGTPESNETCNVARSRTILGMKYTGDLAQHRQ